MAEVRPLRASPVLRLVPRDNRETVSVLKVLLEKAMAGELDGLLIVMRHADGRDDDFASTGAFRDSARSVNAAMRLCWRLTQLQDRDE